MTDWIVLPSPGGDGGGGAQPQQGTVPTIDVPARGAPPSYDPSAPPGSFGSETAPSLVGGPGSKGTGPTTQWVVTPPPPSAGAPGPAPAAPAGAPMPVPPIPPQAPQQPQIVPVPVGMPQQPAPAQPQGMPPAPQQPQMPVRGMPPAMVPAELQPAQRPPQAPQQPMQLAPTIQQQPPGPPGGPSWGHTTGLLAAKALEGVPMMAAGVLDLPQVVGGGIYNYLTAQPRIAGPVAPMPMQPPELAAQQGAPQQPGPPQPPDLSSMPFFGRQVERAYRRMGLPEPQSENEQTAATIAQALGGTAGSIGLGSIGAVARYAPRLAQALASYKTQQMIGAGGSAGASELARRGGAGPGTQFAAALLGGVGAPLAARTVEGTLRGAGAAFASNQKIAARQLAAASSDPATLEARLRAAGGSGLSAPQTTAMAANDQGLARLEKAVRQTPGGAGILRVEADRQTAIADALSRMHPGGGETAAQRGEAIRASMNAHDATIKAHVDQLYTTARGQPGTFSSQPAKDAADAAARTYYPPGSGGSPAAFKSIARQIMTRKAPVTNSWVMAMDRQLGDAARAARMAGNNTLAAALGEVRDGVGRISTTAEHTAARTARARQGAVMGRDASGSNTVGRIVKEDQFGRPNMTGEQVANASVATRAGVQQIIDAGHEAIQAARASGQNVAAVAAHHAATLGRMRAQLLDNAEGAARSVGGEYSAANWRKFWRNPDHDGAARLLFTPAHYADLRAIGDDLLADARIRSMASAQGSHTVQHAAHLLRGDATVAHVIAAASKGSGAGAAITTRIVEELPAIIGGAVGLLHGGAEHGGMWSLLGHTVGRPIIKGLMEHRTEAVQAILHDALADPQIAADLLRRGNAANFARMLQRSRVSNGMFWGLIRRLVPAVAGGEAGQTAYRPAVPQVAPPLARPMAPIPGVPFGR